MNTKYDTYVVVMKTRRLYDLSLKYNSCDVYFQKASCLMYYTQTESGFSHYKGFAASITSKHARVVSAHSPQTLSDVVAEAWCFSISLNRFTD